MRLIRFPETQAKVGLSKRQINRLVGEGKFPARLKIGEKVSGFLESEVDAWIEARVAERGRS